MEKAAENVDAGAAAQLQLKLFGSWASSYTHRVQLAMRLKGLAFEYAEEDLGNKSDALLRQNPVYKKVPVLVHDGRSLAESVIILQYLDDAFPASRQLLPADAFDRAVARFWCHFGDDKLGPAVGAVFASTGEEQEAAVRQVHENLALIEAELREGRSRAGVSSAATRSASSTSSWAAAPTGWPSSRRSPACSWWTPRRSRSSTHGCATSRRRTR